MQSYDKIETIKGLAAVRKRPGMYVGSPRSLNGQNPEALIQIAQEILSNAIDEAYAGFGNQITLTIHKDNSLTVSDLGRGIPRGENFDDVIRAFTVLHSSGKFDSSFYANSIGQNGIGQKATNALSKYIEASVNTEKEHYEIKFQQEKVLSKSVRKRKSSEPTGSTITFLPDDTVFDTINWDDKIIVNKLEQSAFLTPKVKFIFIDERQDNLRKEWYSKNGIADYVNQLSQDETLISGLKKPIPFKGNFETSEEVNGEIKHGKISVEGALIYTENNNETTLSFANGAPTIDGGTHVTGAHSAIFKAFSDYAKDKKLIKKNQKFDSNDTREGLICALLVKIPESLLMFGNQSKTKLSTVEAEDAVKTVIYDCIIKWLYDHPKSAQRVIENIVDTRNAKDAAKKAKQAAREARKTKNAGGKLVVSSKLKVASGRDPKTKSLFITEGDSAAQLLTLVRDKTHQAVFPLRGKILNTEGEKLSAIVKNTEISTIASVLGAGIGPAFDVKDLDYDKVIITTDADTDGLHITSLLITLMYRFFPGLIEDGHLYKVIAPLYKTVLVDKKGHEVIEFAYTESEHADFETRVKDHINHGYKVKSNERWKGLGSMSKQDTLNYLADPNQRKLVQFTVDDVQLAKQMLNLWMGKNAELRKNQIDKTVDFDKIVVD